MTLVGPTKKRVTKQVENSADSAKKTLAELWQKSGNLISLHFCAICAAVLRLEHRRSEKSGNLASLAPISAPLIV